MYLFTRLYIHTSVSKNLLVEHEDMDLQGTSLVPLVYWTNLLPL